MGKYIPRGCRDRYKHLNMNNPSDYYSHSRPEMLPFVPKCSKRILDVGCGSGFFGEAVKRNCPCHVTGIEPSVEASVSAALRLDLVLNSTFEEAEPSEAFDVICFNDVLEHLTNPGLALEKAKRLLVPSGRVVASIPNLRFYPVILQIIRYKDFPYSDAGY